jgi:hypothetical protein
VPFPTFSQLYFSGVSVAAIHFHSEAFVFQHLCPRNFFGELTPFLGNSLILAFRHGLHATGELYGRLESRFNLQEISRGFTFLF